jgi:hypothetical protein
MRVSIVGSRPMTAKDCEADVVLPDRYRISMALTGHETTASSQSQVWH